MAKIFPFQPYRYSLKAGSLSDVVTQPYDKISPTMQARYQAQSPYNLVRIILGERRPSDTDADNVYTRAAGHLRDWIARGVLEKEAEPSLYAYFQEFKVPETNEKAVRKGFIGLGLGNRIRSGLCTGTSRRSPARRRIGWSCCATPRRISDSSSCCIPIQPARSIALLDETAKTPPDGVTTDEYGALHRIWRISDPARIARIQELMADKKLLIADGHHRYETALAFRGENPRMPGVDKVMMTFVNMYGSGVKILATHRLVSNLPDFKPEEFLRRAAEDFAVEKVSSIEDVKAREGIGVAIGQDLYMLKPKDAKGMLDVKILHDILLAKTLGISEDAVREERHTRYIRGLEAAVEEARKGAAQIAFLLKPTTVEQVADVSFGGGVMPQKSTDFYPKLLSGLTIYKL